MGKLVAMANRAGRKLAASLRPGPYAPEAA